MPKNDSVLPAPKVTPAVPAAPPTGIVTGKIHQNVPNGTSIALYVPAAQQQRIVQLREMGKSVREISRREKRHRRTVGKVLLANAERMKEHMEQSRQAFLLLQTDAIQTVQRALKKGDVQTAYRLLTDCGTVPNRQVTAEYQEPSPELSNEQKYIAEFVETVMERGKDFGVHVDSI
jgi:DNA polymerase elongation subunit (family B)